ncbi:MAG: hypothetical protein KatS3mg002_0596 [Candidatus Woesearchaeota archaeon]|nr:MAG: hypothetical protein KatS3mg002_0596 [Candidatus Woesearchaeota archaeon]
MGDLMFNYLKNQDPEKNLKLNLKKPDLKSDSKEKLEEKIDSSKTLFSHNLSNSHTLSNIIYINSVLNKSSFNKKTSNQEPIIKNILGSFTYYTSYYIPNNDYDVVEVDFLGAGIGWEIRGMFIPGNPKPFVLRNLPGPEKYRTKQHELIHKEFYDSGIPQSEYEVRRITSQKTNFNDYYGY